MDGITIKTDIGFECTVRENALNDMRILDALIKVEDRKSDNATKVIKLVEILDALLGEDQKRDLYDFIAEKEGQASSATVSAVIRDIFSKLGEDKKK